MANQISSANADSRPTTPVIVTGPNGHWPNESVVTKFGQAAKAASAITNSGAATATIGAAGGKTNYVTNIIIISGASWVAVDDTVTLSGIKDGPIDIPITQKTTEGTMISIVLSEPHEASAVNTAITLSIPAILGGAKTTLILQGYRD